MAVEPVVEVGSGIGRLNMGKGTTTAQVPSVFDCLSVIAEVDALVGIGAVEVPAVIEGRFIGAAVEPGAMVDERRGRLKVEVASAEIPLLLDWVLGDTFRPQEAGRV